MRNAITNRKQINELDFKDFNPIDVLSKHGWKPGRKTDIQNVTLDVSDVGIDPEEFQEWADKFTEYVSEIEIKEAQIKQLQAEIEALKSVNEPEPEVRYQLLPILASISQLKVKFVKAGDAIYEMYHEVYKTWQVAGGKGRKNVNYTNIMNELRTYLKNVDETHVKMLNEIENANTSFTLIKGRVRKLKQENYINSLKGKRGIISESFFGNLFKMIGDFISKFTGKVTPLFKQQEKNLDKIINL